MPKSAAVKKIPKQDKSSDDLQSNSQQMSNLPVVNLTSLTKYRPSKNILILVIIIAIVTLLYYKKGWFVAATVNNTPIFSTEILAKLNSSYRDQVLNQVINEKILLDEAKKKGIVILSSDIDNKIADIEKNVGGATALDNMLKQQQQTRKSLREQIKLNLVIEKLYASEATVTAEEVKQFISQNAYQLSSSDSAQQTVEATDILKQQKLQQIFSQKFQELKKAASVNIF